jgi:DNA-binding LacI/PurR family transcriptional regulator
VTEQQDGSGSSPRPARPASIRDVARLAGVSHQTVSRVLNGHPSIRDVTKSRVLAAMDQLQFRPSRAARMLSMRRSQTIGILAAAVGSHYGPASSVSAVEDAARDRGYYATVAHLASVAPSAITAAIEELLSQEVEGIVIVAPRTSVLSRLAALPVTVPIVAAQGEPRDAGGIPVATVDQEAGVRLVLEHLIGLGHRRILHVAGPRDWNDAQSRLRAFKAGLPAAGLPWSPPLFGDWTADSGYAIGRALVQEGTAGADGPKPSLPFTAVFSANDQMALGVIHAFREAGLDVPRDVSIVGFDDIPESAHFWPPLTTVRQDFGDLGVRCVTMLLDLIHGAGAHRGGVRGVSVHRSGIHSVDDHETGDHGAGDHGARDHGADHSVRDDGVLGHGAGDGRAGGADDAPAAVAPVVQPRLIIRGSVAPVQSAE